MIAKGEVFDGCVMILYTILGVRLYTAMMGKWERCGYLPAVKYPGRYLGLSSKSSVDVSDVNDVGAHMLICIYAQSQSKYISVFSLILFL